jgi:hypothetical protein
MRESPVACITCFIRRNIMGFVLVPSYALGMRTADAQHHQTKFRKSHPRNCTYLVW